jgi:hypothetical protein
MQLKAQYWIRFWVNSYSFNQFSAANSNSNAILQSRLRYSKYLIPLPNFTGHLFFTHSAIPRLLQQVHCAHQRVADRATARTISELTAADKQRCCPLHRPCTSCHSTPRRTTCRSFISKCRQRNRQANKLMQTLDYIGPCGDTNTGLLHSR